MFRHSFHDCVSEKKDVEFFSIDFTFSFRLNSGVRWMDGMKDNEVNGNKMYNDHTQSRTSILKCRIFFVHSYLFRSYFIQTKMLGVFFSLLFSGLFVLILLIHCENIH